MENGEEGGPEEGKRKQPTIDYKLFVLGAVLGI